MDTLDDLPNSVSAQTPSAFTPAPNKPHPCAGPVFFLLEPSLRMQGPFQIETLTSRKVGFDGAVVVAGPPQGSTDRAPHQPDAHVTHVKSPDLSERQLAVLQCLVQGKSNKVIAREIGIAEGTVKAHLWVIYQLLGVNNRVQAMQKVFDLKLR